MTPYYIGLYFVNNSKVINYVCKIGHVTETGDGGIDWSTPFNCNSYNDY